MAELGGMLAAAILKVVGDQIGSAIGGQIKLLKDFTKDLEKMKMALESVEAVLEDAERLSITDKPTRLWLKRLKDAMYAISDMIDEFESDSEAITKPSARKFSLKRYLAVVIPCLTIGPRITIANEMEKMREELEVITDQHKKFRFSSRSNVLKAIDIRETSSIIETEVIGRDKEREKLLCSLSESMTKEMTILPIYGIGGLGKSTLAKIVYNSSQFKDYSRVWIYVSQTFDLKKIGSSIISQLSENVSQQTDLQTIQNSLSKLLAGKKILIVLDDLWEDKESHLDSLKAMLKVGKGSKVVVVVTTRAEDIAQKISTIQPHKLEPLTDNMCWSIIKQKSSFESRDDKEQLEQIGMGIAMKCGGVVLAAQSLGHMLHSMTASEWESVRNSDIWNISSLEDTLSTNVLASLRLSYSVMPLYLKLCFAYCAIFPKGHKIVKDDLIHQWVSLSFIEPTNVFSFWQLGERYIRQLVGLSFLQDSKSLSMSRAWMYADRRSGDFIKGVHSFLKVAEATKRNGFMCCPCGGCRNEKDYPSTKTLHIHLFRFGFMSGYNCWTKHGERGVMMEDNDEEENDDNYPEFPETTDTAMEDNEEEEGEERASDMPADDLGQVIVDAQIDCESEKEREKLERMLDDHKKDLYPNCEDGQKKLRSTLELLQWKAESGLSDKGFEKLLKIMKKMLPKDNELPASTYEAKKIVCPLGLEVQKIHACINDCILYRGEYENLNACPVCSAFRYKIRRDDPGDVEGERPRKRVPAKVMWYAPIIPRLKRLFRNKEHAKLLRWHKEDRKSDEMLRHPADGSQWRKIDRDFPEFTEDARNLRFGLSTDGMNPFGEQSCSHSTWPVTLCIYNLPPWLCMKRKFIMMPVLIQGPKQPGNDIDVYLRPLVDELLQLWQTEGVRVWDEYKQEEFDLRALLFVTINDWPALSNLSGQTNKGYNACTHCLGEIDSIYLDKSKKVVYLGHRRFLSPKHQLKKKGKHFKGEAEVRGKPKRHTGDDIFDMVKDLEVIFGKGPGSLSVPNDASGHAPMWKKKSIFWELEYWKFLEVRSAIDVMHVTKNVCVNLLGFLGLYGKTKDTPEAREDQHRMKRRDGMHPEDSKGPASYALTKEEKEIFFECLSSIKVPSGFSSNIKGIINMAEKKFQNLKSHDCHVLMTQLLPVALRGILPENVRVPIVKLCAFLNAISQKVINPEDLQRLQNDVAQCLVSFELVFPPSFFNIMTHLLVHLVEEITILGPVFLHNMFPFERFMGVLKKYVHNRARPEGSISKGYLTEEVIEFCVDFVPDLNPIGLPQSRHEGRLSGKGTLGMKSAYCMDGHSLSEAHYTVLRNSTLVEPYMERHKNIVRSENPGQSNSWITKLHMATFGGWLQTLLINDATVGYELSMLAKKPSSTILTFQGYEINGNIFYTVAQDKKSTNQNSGVRFDALHDNGTKDTYYGYIEEIWELDYGPSFKVPLFRCKWVKLTGGGVVVDQKYGITTVDLNNLAYMDEPFVLANDVAQVFYVKDMFTKPRKRKDKKTNTSHDEPKRHIVLSGKRIIVGVEDKTDMSEDYNKFDEIPPFRVNTDPTLLLNKEDTPWLRCRKKPQH